MTRRVALITYSTRPRGGVVHTLRLAEALVALGEPVEIVALGDPAKGWFTGVDVPYTIVPAPPWLPTLEERVFAAVDALAAALRESAGSFQVLHTQDCISARAAARVRDEGAPVAVLRTVHHIDDFHTEALIDCQRQAVLEPDEVLVVSRFWQRTLAKDYGVRATVVRNGVVADRFARPPAGLSLAELRFRAGATKRPLILAVGGIEPRKGSVELFEALARLRDELEPSPMLAVIGGQSFQDHQAYRDRALARAAELGLVLDHDIVQLGTVDDAELPAWYHAADVLAFPSVSEGWGLVVLEALAAGLPAVVTDIPVFREYLTDGEGALMVPPGAPDKLAAALRTVLIDRRLAARLAAAGPAVARRYPWSASAEQHRTIYLRLTEPTRPGKAPADS
ncbi:MAG TPA: MSMEG_0565 family glycosyltransferase [Actinomycetes bacterium]|nr:MSMEG_0565 family glycosyltransferase [Actinomycetes bacterium]